MSINYMTAVWARAVHLRGTKLIMLLAIADHADNDTGECWPGIPRLARMCRVEQRQAKKLLAELIADEEVFVLGGGVGRGNKKVLKISPYYNLEKVSSRTPKGVPQSAKGVRQRKPPLAPSYSEPSKNHHKNLPKRDKDALRAHAEDIFKADTQLPVPKKESEAGAMWYSPLREFCELAEWDEARITDIIQRAIKDMRAEGLSIYSPKSIQKKVYEVVAEAKGGGGKSGQESDASWRARNFGNGQS